MVLKQSEFIYEVSLLVITRLVALQLCNTILSAILLDPFQEKNNF